MSKTISIEDAAEGFERLIEKVKAGEEYVITRDGRPVARLVPIRGFGPLDDDSLRQRGWPERER